MQIDSFNHSIDTWIRALQGYSYQLLCIRPSPAGWSLGQVYMHLVADSVYYIDQIKICLINNDHAAEEASATARTMFLNNDFPDTSIEGDPSNNLVPQPQSKEKLLRDLLNVKNEMNELAILIIRSTNRGKTKHPGLGFFSGREWLQFADMHFRHHLRQKKRIDDFLNQSSRDISLS